ncbi:MAG: hypothetical protein HXS48_21340 [Theionarchaea archaeon]|nr:MAG: hypothetical protein AYK19_09210 [Theionarchaea archaeon DG-70-1]MBU7029491.1 hypothetical protein [Theionarchaea archaeon]
MHNENEGKKEGEKQKKLDTFTKIGIVVIIAAIIAIFIIASMPLNIYVRAIIVIALIGIIIKLAERVIIDIYDMWHIFDFWQRLRR